MTPTWRIIGLGQRAAGDDGVGLVVVDALLQAALPAGGEILGITDPTDLVGLLIAPGRVILVDALIDAGPPGTLRVLSLDRIAAVSLAPWSSHGLSVVQAVQMARILFPDTACRDVRVVAIAIDPPRFQGQGLSPAVAAAVPHAVRTMIGLIGG